MTTPEELDRRIAIFEGLKTLGEFLRTVGGATETEVISGVADYLAVLGSKWITMEPNDEEKALHLARLRLLLTHFESFWAASCAGEIPTDRPLDFHSGAGYRTH